MYCNIWSDTFQSSTALMPVLHFFPLLIPEASVIIGPSRLSNKKAWKATGRSYSNPCSIVNTGSGYWCYHCNGIFMTQTLLTEHLVKLGCKKPWQCEKCSLSFMHRSTLNRHRRICGGSFRLKQHACHICSRQFTYRHDLKRHVQTVHNLYSSCLKSQLS